MEDGEIEDGFLGHHEIESRRALAAAHGAEGSSVSWVEAVLLGAGHVAPLNEAEDEEDGDPVPDNHTECAAGRREPPPPGTAADLPPPSGAVLARREAALVHSVTALLREGDDSEALLDVLAEAASNGVDVVRWLGHGRSSIGGRTPLMEAAMQGRTACCAVLADAARSRGRGLNARNERGRYSALHYACYHGAGGASLELLVRGADPRLRNMEGETALQSALANGRNECAELVNDFLRRPTFEPETGVAAGVAKSGVSGKGKGRRDEIIGAGGVGAAPEVCRANAVFCLGRRRRRSGAGVRPGRGLGVGVGTAGAEVGLGARRGARLHATNPCAGTPMEAFVLWSIASGYDPFHGEGAGQDEEEEEESQSGTRRWRGGGAGGRRTAGVWLEYYIRVYNASMRQWYQHQRSLGEARSRRPKAAGDPWRTGEGGGVNQAACAAPKVTRSAREGSTYALVVQKSKALEEGRRFELHCGSDVVIGRSQNIAGIVVKDELVSKSHLRIVNSVESGVRLCDLGSKHGAVITKPAPNTSIAKIPYSTADGQRAERGVGGGQVHVERPAGLGGKDPPIATGGNPSALKLKPKPPPPPPNPPKKKFYPIPVPREPEWVAGAHGDRISLGKTVLVLERKGGPEPSGLGGRQSVHVDTHARAGPDAVRAVEPRAQKQRRPAVISKRFTANPNLMDAIRSAEEMERARKRTAAASELAAAAAAEYLSNKRARSASASATSPPCTPLPPSTSRVSRMEGAGGNAGTGTVGAAAAVSIGDGGRPQEGCDDYGHVSKGSMLLKRMGWTEGQGLGRWSDGQLQTITVERRGERAGLGTSQSSDNNPFAVGADGRISKWEQMRRRFAEAQSAGPGFGGAKRAGSGAGVKWLKGGVQKGLG